MSELSRRSMLKVAGATTATISFAPRVLARLADGRIVVQDHIVPAEKNLTPEWIAQLTARGRKEKWTGAALESIGMPVGGIATGQLYLCGDGTLGCWEIFNRHDYQNQGPFSYANRPIPKTVDFGFTISVNGTQRSIDKLGFREITFTGEHPIATIRYEDGTMPVVIRSTVYTPFIPLNSYDSALPATIFELEFENIIREPIKFDIASHLQNVCGSSRTDAKRSTANSSTANSALIVHDVAPVDPDKNPVSPRMRKEVVFADFEGSDYGNWKVTGEAFGKGPAQGTLADQQSVTNFVGHGLVNTFFKGDGTIGRLTSPSFKIERDYINFKIGGGNRTGVTCINLLVDSKIVRTATGLNNERLEWETWNVSDLAGKNAVIEIVDEATDGWGHINVDQILFADQPRTAKELNARHGNANRDTGSMAILAFGVKGASVTTNVHGDMGEIDIRGISLKPGEKRTYQFVLGWYFPFQTNGRNYANFFKDAGEVVNYVAKNHKRLSRETKLWRDTYYDSTLPYWLLDRLHMTVGNLATGMTEWWKSGRFWAWEGVVCCSGTCTHVWNYEHSMARLFPDIERSIRTRQDFGAGFDTQTGLVGFRSDREYATDGQAGTILKAYREHLVSANGKFLKEQWPHIKKALQFLIQHDANGDGIIEDAQPNTYDIDFFGANTFCGSLYLAALRAGEEMAREMKDSEFAATCAKLAVSGKEATMKRLWNGEYFIQEVDQSKYTQYQYGPGCLADQLFGQGWAHQVGLGYIYPRENVKKALQSVWRYNWAPDVAGQNKRWPPQRPFALPGEGGLFTCTWPTGGREKEPVLYRDEVWTGIEYQVAGHMIWEGLVTEGLAICRAVHERYHPLKRNPYNEVECSDHYARAMASWGVFTALSGFDYHGPAGRMKFAPAGAPESFRSAFTAAEGWGTYDQTAHKRTLKVGYGRLRLTELTVPFGAHSGASVQVNGEATSASVSIADGKLTLKFEEGVTLRAGQSVEITLSS